MPHRSLQPLPHLVRFPGLQADLLGALAGGKDFGLKVEPLVRQRAQGVGQLEVDKMLGCLGGAQFRLSPRTPSVRFRAQIFNLVDGGRCTKKCGNIVWKSGGRQPIDHAMAFTLPGAG